MGLFRSTLDEAFKPCPSTEAGAARERPAPRAGRGGKPRNGEPTGLERWSNKWWLGIRRSHERPLEPDEEVTNLL